jgi:hypothetical protein
MVTSTKTAAAPQGFLSKFAAALRHRIRRLFRKNEPESPNIYPFF